jgi:hypothetical protein
MPWFLNIGHLPKSGSGADFCRAKSSKWGNVPQNLALFQEVAASKENDSWTGSLELVSYTLLVELLTQHAVCSKIAQENRHERFTVIRACPLYIRLRAWWRVAKFQRVANASSLRLQGLSAKATAPVKRGMCVTPISSCVRKIKTTSKPVHLFHRGKTVL